MSERIVVDPITRIEGHLRIEAQTDGDTITEAYSSGTMVRGLELIMQGRDPRDAWAYAQRICGVCTGVHALQSVRAIEDALGIDDDAIARGLRTMQPNDNRGRLNVFALRGATVIVDFAHNPHGVAAIADLAAALPAKRRLLVLGQAGDRSDVAMRDLASAAWSLRPDRILLKEMAEYARGRAPGEVISILRGALLDAGADPAHIDVTADEISAIEAALDWLQPEARPFYGFTGGRWIPENDHHCWFQPVR